MLVPLLRLCESLAAIPAPIKGSQALTEFQTFAWFAQIGALAASIFPAPVSSRSEPVQHLTSTQTGLGPLTVRVASSPDFPPLYARAASCTTVKLVLVDILSSLHLLGGWIRRTSMMAATTNESRSGQQREGGNIEWSIGIAFCLPLDTSKFPWPLCCSSVHHRVLSPQKHF